MFFPNYAARQIGIQIANESAAFCEIGKPPKWRMTAGFDYSVGVVDMLAGILEHFIHEPDPAQHIRIVIGECTDNMLVERERNV
jgi:hypothetical protein